MTFATILTPHTKSFYSVSAKVDNSQTVVIGVLTIIVVLATGGAVVAVLLFTRRQRQHTPKQEDINLPLLMSSSTSAQTLTSEVIPLAPKTDAQNIQE